MEENVSNALMMAASVLIGLIVLSAFVLLFASFSNSSARIEERLAEAQIKEFNSKYEIYSYLGDSGEYNTKVTIYDIVSLINFTYQYNHDLYSESECQNYNQNTMPFYVEVNINFGALRSISKEVKDVTATGSNPYQEASKTVLNTLMRNAYFNNENDSVNWETTDNIHRFTCTGIDYNTKTGRVNKISFAYAGTS